MPDDGVAARIEDALVPVLPANAVVLVALLAEHLEDLSGPLTFAHTVTGDHENVADLGTRSGVSHLTHVSLLALNAIRACRAGADRPSGQPLILFAGKPVASRKEPRHPGKAAEAIGGGTDAKEARPRDAVHVKSGSPISHEELEALVVEYHQVQEEHRRARRGSRVRRHLRARLAELESRLDRLLAEAVADERERSRWRLHLRHRTGEPATPTGRPPLLFRGRSEAGSTLEIFERADCTLDAVVDGALVERLAGADELLTTLPGLTFRLEPTIFHETFACPREALDVLVAMLEGSGPPPYGHARELLLDGLIDRNFGLTPRGRRVLETARRHRARRVRRSVA